MSKNTPRRKTSPEPRSDRPSFGRKKGEIKPPLDFDINGDTYWAAGAAPFGVVEDLADLSSVSGNLESVSLMAKFLDAVMLPESAALFATRLRDTANPMESDEIGDAFGYLVGEYTGKRPTQPVASSPGGSGTTGTTSSDAASSEGSTSDT